MSDRRHLDPIARAWPYQAVVAFGGAPLHAAALALLGALSTLAPVLMGHRPGRASLPWLARAWWASAAHWTVAICGTLVLVALAASRA
jgi:hypothetical protein